MLRLDAHRGRRRLALGGVTVLAAVALAVCVGREPGPERLLDPADVERAEEAWFGVYFRGRRIGWTQAARGQRRGGGHALAQRTVMWTGRNDAGPLDVRIRAETDGRLRLEAFRFEARGGPARTRGRGRVRGGAVEVEIESGGGRATRTLTLPERPVLRLQLGPLLARDGLEPGARHRYLVLDPLTLRAEPVEVEVVGPDPVTVTGREIAAVRVRLTAAGVRRDAWLDRHGRILRQDLGLGLSAVRETADEARAAPADDPPDLVAATTIPVSGLPARLDRARSLTLRLDGPLDGFAVDDGARQRRDGNRITIRREVPGTGGQRRPADPALAEALAAEPLAPADHPRIRALAARLAGDAADTLAASRRIVAWLRENVRPTDVPGVPSALETLRTRAGDCNEHATLFAALARAAGVPTRVVAGLVYRDGRFAYHAWNEVWVGGDRWVTVDPMWGQIPADVGHVRLVRGGPERQVDLLRLMGRLQVDVVAVD